MKPTVQLHPEAPRPERDFRVIHHGSVYTVHPLTAEAQQWWDDHVEPTPALGNGYAVEPRFLETLVTGIEADGFTI